MKVALITGSTRGIGRAIALRLAEEGYAIALNGRHRTSAVDELLVTLQSYGVKAAFFACDVSDAVAVDAMREAVEAQLGQVDVLVNNAGIAQQKLFTDITPTDWRQMMGTHLDGTFFCSRAFLPAMIRRHSGVIINISSMWGQVGASCEVHYSAAKAGVIGLTKALAKEVAPSGVRVNCVAPGAICTDMLSEFSDQELRELSDEIPMMRLGNPQEVAEAVVFLASDKSSYFTGQILSPNGGFVI